MGTRQFNHFIACLLMACTLSTSAEESAPHADHEARMKTDASGMVMNANHHELPLGCEAISADYEFEVSAGTEFAARFPGTTYGFSLHEYNVEPCSQITVTFINTDTVRHQWMVHGLPRYLYPQGMFHLEAAGGARQTGTFIVPADDQTYLVHCDVTQHMEKGMKGQLKVGRGSGDLWAVPGVSNAFNTTSYLPIYARLLFALAAIAGIIGTWWLLKSPQH
jgi:plastocyanin